MRITVDLPEREQALFTGLTRERGTSLGKLLIELGIVACVRPPMKTRTHYRIDPQTGLGCSVPAVR